MFSNLIQQLKDIETAVASGNYQQAWKLSIDLQQSAYTLLFGSNARHACSPEECTQLEACCQSLEATCRTTRAAGNAAIGDGHILQLLIQLAPLILALFKTPQPT